jgi:hypothetical protein
MKECVCVLAVTIAFLLSACVSDNSEPRAYRFTKEKVAQISTRSSQSDIRALFGEPDSVSSGQCGQLTRTGPWQCVTWVYTLNQYRANRFIWHVSPEGASLNDWDVISDVR